MQKQTNMQYKNLLNLFIALLLNFLCLSTYADDEHSHDKQAKTHHASKTIITSFYPLYYFTQQLLNNLSDEKIDVVNLSFHVPIHDYKLTPKDRVKIQKSDLFILFGDNLEPWGEAVSSELSPHRVLTINAKHDEHDEHDNHSTHDKHDEHDEHDDAEHHHDHNDPHLWLDPIYAQSIVSKIHAKLLSLPHYAKYQITLSSNATALNKKLSTLNNDFRKKMTSCVQDDVIVSHDALGYLARRYGFETHSILGFSTHDEPSAKTLRTLIDKIRTDNIQYFLNDGGHQSQSYLSTIDPENKLKSLPFYTLEQHPRTDDNFFSLSYKNLTNLLKARKCQL